MTAHNLKKTPVEQDWRALCEAASKETDTQRLLELVDEIDRLLGERSRERAPSLVPAFIPAPTIPPGGDEPES